MRRTVDLTVQKTMDTETELRKKDKFKFACAGHHRAS